MAVIAIQQALAAGITPTYAAASAGGDTVVADNRTALYVKNASAAAITVTVASQRPPLDGYSVANKVVNIAAGADGFIGMDQGTYTSSATGVASVTYSAVTSVTVAAFRI